MSIPSALQSTCEPPALTKPVAQLRIVRKLSRCGSELSAAEKLVLLNLLERLGKKSEAWPSMDTIARDTDYSRRSVIRAIAGLEQRGWITRRRLGQGKPNRYAFDMPALLAWAADGSPRSDRESPLEVTPETLEGSQGEGHQEKEPITITAGMDAGPKNIFEEDDNRQDSGAVEPPSLGYRFDCSGIVDQAVELCEGALARPAAVQLMSELFARHTKDEWPEIAGSLPAWLVVIGARMSRKKLDEPVERARYLSGSLKLYRLETERDVSMGPGGKVVSSCLTSLLKAPVAPATVRKVEVVPGAARIPFDPQRQGGQMVDLVISVTGGAMPRETAIGLLNGAVMRHERSRRPTVVGRLPKFVCSVGARMDRENIVDLGEREDRMREALEQFDLDGQTWFDGAAERGRSRPR